MAFSQDDDGLAVLDDLCALDAVASAPDTEDKEKPVETKANSQDVEDRGRDTGLQMGLFCTPKRAKRRDAQSDDGRTLESGSAAGEDEPRSGSVRRKMSPPEGYETKVCLGCACGVYDLTPHGRGCKHRHASMECQILLGAMVCMVREDGKSKVANA